MIQTYLHLPSGYFTTSLSHRTNKVMWKCKETPYIPSWLKCFCSLVLLNRSTKCNLVKSTYLLFLIIRIFPIWKSCTLKQTPSPMPRPKSRHILKHGKKSPFPYIQLKFWAELQLNSTFQWGRVSYLQLQFNT